MFGSGHGSDDLGNVVTSGRDGFEDVTVFSVAVVVERGPPPGGLLIGFVD